MQPNKESTCILTCKEPLPIILSESLLTQMLAGYKMIEGFGREDNG